MKQLYLEIIKIKYTLKLLLHLAHFVTSICPPRGTVPAFENLSSTALSLPQHWLPALQANHRLYPQGVDFFFCFGEAIAALPRSTLVEAG